MITIEESVITLVFFCLLIITAFGADKYNSRKLAKQREKEGLTGDERDGLPSVTFQDFYHILALQHSGKAMTDADKKKK